MNHQNENKNDTKDILLPNGLMRKFLVDSYYNKYMQELDDIDVDMNHLENIFSDETYYLAMKLVPLLEKKVLYLTYIENVRLNDICRRLKISKNEVISARVKGINHFKNNLHLLSKANNLKGGKKWKKQRKET